MRYIGTLIAFACAAATGAAAQLPDGSLLWSMDSVYVLVTVDDHAGIVSRRGLANQVQRTLTDDGLNVTDGAGPGLLVRATVREVAHDVDEGPTLQMWLSVSLTDHVTRVKYVDAALTRCMSASGCRRNVEGARALGSWGILWHKEWLGSAETAAAATSAITQHLEDLVAAFLAAHATANHR